jgi:acyl CoA:acetate/3-ketoacid CoA transferase alpha subunit
MIPIAPKRPVGRPLVAIDYQAVAELAKLGLSLDTIADRIGVDRTTLTAHMTRHPELRAAYNAGVADLVAIAAGKLRDMVMAGDLGAVIFTLRTKGGFTTPKQEVSVTVTQSGPTIDGHVTDIAIEHSRLLDGPNPDDYIPDIEIVE